MSKQKARNTAAGMVRDALEQLTKWERVQDLRHFNNTKEEATRLLDMAQNALDYFKQHYDFPQEDAGAMVEAVRDALNDSSDVWDSDLLDEINEIVFPNNESEASE